MVKLRGVNIWPEAVGEIAGAIDGVLPDFFVRAIRQNNRDELVIAVVSDRNPATFDDIQRAVETKLQQQLGVKIGAEVVRPGEIDHLTEFHTSPKPKRFRDERK